VIKLIDFGAAKHAAAQANANAEILLKEGYAPLEQYRRDTRQGTYTDIYAVAALFYRMLAGKKPPSARSRFKEDTLSTLSDMGVNVPDYAEMAIMTSLNLQPQHRIQTAYEFMEALNGADFVPRYEPEWILPHQEDETKKTGFSRLIEKFSTASIGVKAAVILGFLLIAGGGMTGILMIMPDNNVAVVANGKGIVTVDALEGKTLSTVREELEQEGITELSVTYVLNDAEYDTVLSQSVAAGSVIDTAQDTSIELTVSGGNQYVTLNRYVEMPLEEAKKALETDGVSYEVQEVCSDDQPKGTVYDQSVSPGDLFDVTSSKLTLSVSRGPKSDYDCTVPDLSGMTVSAAKEKLKELGLTSSLLTVKTEKESGYNSNVDEGKVGSQSISSGQKLNLVDLESSKKTITLYTSRGEEPKPESTPTPIKKSSQKSSEKKKSKSSSKSSSNLPNVQAEDEYGNLW
jgi:beta-lactam-binding protein with PASTA domain